MRRLFGFGQVIASAIPIPGAAHLSDRSEASPSLSILRDDSEGMESEAAAGFSRDGDALRLTVPGVATYRCRARAITVAPCPSAAPTDLSELLVASALPAALWMQGRLVLHAAAVCTHAGGRALGLMGRSGSGKSTLAAGLVARGAVLLADDSIAIAGGSGDRQRPAWRPVPARRRRDATVLPPRSASDDRRGTSRRADTARFGSRRGQAHSAVPKPSDRGRALPSSSPARSGSAGNASQGAARLHRAGAVNPGLCLAAAECYA